MDTLNLTLSSETSFRKTSLLRKQLTSPISFGLSNSSKKDVVLPSLSSRKM